MSRLVLGLDFGTESVRALLVDLRGREYGLAVAKYRHGQITDALPGTGERLPNAFALQHPSDWLESASKATRGAMRAAGALGKEVIGLGVDFTSCTMLPALADGTPLCVVPKFARNKFAWPKLWKHHGAVSQTDRINAVARDRGEPWLDHYGGAVGLEWFFPKMLETIEAAPAIAAAAEVWIEAGDWLVWQLTGDLIRSTCQAGYKALWNRQDGFPSADFFHAVDPRLASAAGEKMPGELRAPGEAAGVLTGAMAKRLGLAPGVPVSTATIDAHAGVPGAGAAEPGTLVMVLGTSSCHMLNAQARRSVPGVAGIVEDGILPGFVGYETGQAAVGDAFEWLRRIVGSRSFDTLNAQAANVPAGADGVLCVDWLNGCRTPLMDGCLRGMFTGLTLSHTPAHLYRALLEGTAFGLRWIVELLRERGLPVERFVATGGLPHQNPLLVQIYADALGEPVAVHPSRHGPALGAAVLGALAAGEFDTPAAAIESMAVRKLTHVRPGRRAARQYDPIYARYRAAARWQSGET